MVKSKRAKRQLNKIQEAVKVPVQGQQLKAIGYVRVSTEEQSEHGNGLDYQAEAIKAFAISQGYELLDIIADGGISGASLPAEREGFSTILQMVEDKAFDVLLVWKFDRLARHLVYAVQTVNELQDKGIILRSVTEPIDTASPMGQVLFSVLAGMAVMERANIVSRTKSGRISKAEKGGYATGQAPLGYEVTDNGLEVVEEEAATVRRIFELREEGLSLRAIASRLTEEGHKTKKGGKWYASTVAAILDNVKYSGHVEYVFQPNNMIEFPGKHVLAPGQHQAIIDSSIPFAN